MHCCLEFSISREDLCSMYDDHHSRTFTLRVVSCECDASLFLWHKYFHSSGQERSGLIPKSSLHLWLTLIFSDVLWGSRAPASGSTSSPWWQTTRSCCLLRHWCPRPERRGPMERAAWGLSPSASLAVTRPTTRPAPPPLPPGPSACPTPAPPAQTPTGSSIRTPTIVQSPSTPPPSPRWSWRRPSRISTCWLTTLLSTQPRTEACPQSQWIPLLQYR